MVLSWEEKLHLPATAALFIKSLTLEIMLCLEAFICIECSNRMYIGQKLWTLKDTFTANTLIKISSGKTHLENVRYVNLRSKKRILVGCIYPSLRKHIGVFHFNRAEKTYICHGL